MIDLLLSRATDPKQIDWLNKNKDSAMHLLDAISDIIDIFQVEADRLTFEETNFSLLQAIDQTIYIQKAQAQAKGLSLARDTPLALPDLLFGNALRLKQILINFIGNAIKFSTHGQITVHAHAVEEDNHSALLRIAVTDQGTGISPEEQARLFHVFTQADGSMNRKYGDKGQGLIISKRLAILMNGDIGMISEEGQGSTFWVTVKFKKCAKVLAAPITVNVSKNVDAEPMIERLYLGSHILVVEDESANRMLSKILLESAGLVVDAAQNGTKAVALVQERSYAAIFMDMQMPRLNGVEAAQEIRLLPGYRDTPIIAMTANAFAEDKAQWAAAGITDFLIKPFSPDQLFSILLRALTRHDR